MRFSRAAIALAAVAAVALFAGSALAEEPAGVCVLQAEHKFGMEWNGRAPGEVKIVLPDQVLRLADEWLRLPDRLEAAAAWTTFALGAVVMMGACLIVAGVVAVARNK